MKALILLTMVFLHIVDDFYLQGILASMKQKKWWKGRTPDKLYKNDYIAALIIHGYSWSFIVHLPFIGLIILCDLFQYIPVWTFSVVGHAIVHAVIDHEKVNNNTLNLIEDQIFHMAQIALIWGTMYI